MVVEVNETVADVKEVVVEVVCVALDDDVLVLEQAPQ